MPRRFDPLTREERSHRMGLVRGADTQPELTVRKALWALGYRYRLHVAGLPGKPDIVFPGRRKIVFVHGCFWHRHPGCSRTRTPRTRVGFWTRKFEENVRRDRRARAALARAGWKSLVIWECDVENHACLTTALRRFLEGTE